MWSIYVKPMSTHCVTHQTPSEVALSYNVVLPLGQDFYFPGNNHIIRRLVHYKHSRLNPLPNLGGAILGRSVARLGSQVVMMLKADLQAYVFERHKGQALTSTQKSFLSAHHFTVGVGVTGEFAPGLNARLQGHYRIIVLNKASQVCGVLHADPLLLGVWLHRSVPFSGFVLSGCGIHHFALLK
jgi:hypothetical protein